MAAKKNIEPEMLKESIASMINYATNTKKRNFTETVEIHFGLKNFDPTRDKRIAGNVDLPHNPRQKFKCVIWGNEKHIMEAKELGLDYRSLDDLQGINRDKKLVKKIGKSYDKILCSASVIRQVPRLLGPQLSRMGKFPVAIRPNESIAGTVDKFRRNVKFQLKFKTGAPMCLSAPVGHIGMNGKDLEENVIATVNFVLSLMNKGWMNIKKIHIKSTMGPSYTIYGGLM